MGITCCIGCGGRDFTSSHYAGLPVEVSINGKVFTQPEYYIRRCVLCGLAYKSEILSPAQLREYYDEVDYSKWETEGLYPTELAILKTLTRLPQGSRILDYGCSTGRLLSGLTDRHNCFGVELNDRAALVAKSKGITLLPEEQVLNANAPGFDAIVLSDVFEHLLEPTKILQSLAGNLNRGGLLLICTGNADARACRNDIANFWYFRTPEHVSMITKKYAEYFAGKMRLKIVFWRKMCHYSPGFVDKLKQQLQHTAYWQLNGTPPSIWRPVIRRLPGVRRAANWRTQPLYTFSKDHVVAGFSKAL
jgi:SAM-dependent methyltransferase